MSAEVTKYLIDYLCKKSKLPEDLDLASFNYIDAGYVDSMAVMKFIVDIEAEYDIEFEDSEIESDEFRTIGGLVSIIQRKLG